MSGQGSDKKPAGKKKEVKTGVTDTAQQACVLLGKQPAVGLFVLKAVEPAKAEKSSDNAKVMEIADKSAPPPQFTLCFVDGQGYLQKVSKDDNPWHQVADQLEEIAELRRKAITEKKRNSKKPGLDQPIFAKKPCLNPHGEKLMPGTKHRLCLVAHPNPNVAFALLDHMNGRKVAAPPFPLPADKKSLIFECEPKTDEEGDGKLLHVDLPTEAKHYWPPGHARYGGWVLYRDMPYGHVDSARDAVRTWANDLASVRYPTGEDEKLPYPGEGMSQEDLDAAAAVANPDLARQDDDDDADEPTADKAPAAPAAAPAAATAKPKAGASKGDKEKPHSGFFGTTLMATTHAFQKDAAAGTAFVLADSMRKAIPGSEGRRKSWAYLVGASPRSPIGKAGAIDLTKLATDHAVGIGVVTKAVGDAIVDWSSKGYTKPGDILVRTTLSSALWARWELTRSLALWDALAKALGYANGIKMNCTFRELTVPAGTGRVECSNHKLGLSVDLMSFEHRSIHEKDWPVRYEANWDLIESKELKAANQKVQDSLGLLKKARAKLAESNGQNAKAAEKVSEAFDKATKAETERDALLAAETEGDSALGKSKGRYNLLWRIYAPSVLDVSAKPSPKADAGAAGAAKPAAAAEAPKALSSDPKDAPPFITPEAMQAEVGKRFGVTEEGPWKIEADLEKTLRASFPNTTDPEASKTIDAIVADTLAWSHPILDNLYKMAGDGGKGGMLASLFRYAVRPFDYNPFEPDGGTSLAPELPGSFVPGAKSWLNLTRLGFYCGERRISAQRGKATGTFKNPLEDPLYKPKNPKVALKPVTFGFALPVKNNKPAPRKAGDIGKMLVRLKLAMDDLAKYPDAGPAKVVPTGGKAEDLALADLDGEFIEDWGKLMKKEKTALTYRDLALIYPYSADDKGDKGRQNPLDPFMDKEFHLIEAREATGMGTEVGKKATLKAWLEQLATGAKKAAGDDDTDGDEAGGKGKAKKPPKQSKKKKTLDWTVVILPHFGSAGLKDKRIDEVIMPAMGQPAPLEWWHYDNLAMAGTWAAMAEIIGYSKELVRAADTPPETVGEDGTCQGGLGFAKVDYEPLRSKPGAPENWSDIPDGG